MIVSSGMKEILFQRDATEENPINEKSTKILDNVNEGVSPNDQSPALNVEKEGRSRLLGLNCNTG